MQVSMARLTKRELLGQPEGETSGAIRVRVERGRAVQAERYESPVTTNSSACKAELDAALSTGAEARVALEGAIDALMLSGRGVDRVLRVARTIADLEGEREIGAEHLNEALMFRAQVREAACVG
jgi:magnesium chelatase family protein